MAQRLVEPVSPRWTQRLESRRQATGGLLRSVLALGGVALTATDATAKKKHKHQKPRCGTDETRCPTGFPSACCPAAMTCCDTSRVGCCEV